MKLITFIQRKKEDVMKLVEQSWDLGVRINRIIATERERAKYAVSPNAKIRRLTVISERTYARYLRRLKKKWS